MELTGATKIAFNNYLLDNNICCVKYSDGDYNILFDHFEKSMKFGVFVDFFDSVGIDIGVVRNKKGNFNSWCAMSEDWDIISRALPTQEIRKTARIQAIEKADKLYNNL